MSMTFIIPAGKPALLACVDGLSSDRRWRVTITEYRANRSLEQNSLFHALVGDIATYSGDTFDRTKEAIKNDLGLQIVSKVTGKSIPKPTHEYTVDEMSDLCTRVIAFMAEFQIPMGQHHV